MGKRIISQARGKGSLTYRVRKRAFMHKVGYPKKIKEGEYEIIKILMSAGHSAPLLKCKIQDEIFYNPAFNGALEGSKFSIGGSNFEEGNIIRIEDLETGTKVYNIERNPGDGGRMIRTPGSSATVNKTYDYGKIGILMPNRKEIKLDGKCRATVGVVAGEGKKLKPFVKAGRKFYKMKAKGKLYPRVSAVSVNAIDHPFGSGRGKNVGSKTVKRNASPGQKVGHLRPRKTGKKR